MIRTDCYLAVLKKYKEQYPDAVFEIVTRSSNSILAPSWQLLRQYKSDKISFDEYIERYKKEILSRRSAIDLMFDINHASKKHNIFLVCYEKDAKRCHRSILKELIENIESIHE